MYCISEVEARALRLEAACSALLLPTRVADCHSDDESRGAASESDMPRVTEDEVIALLNPDYCCELAVAVYLCSRVIRVISLSRSAAAFIHRKAHAIYRRALAESDRHRPLKNDAAF
jgi:hypothetical protein